MKRKYLLFIVLLYSGGIIHAQRYFEEHNTWTEYSLKIEDNPYIESKNQYLITNDTVIAGKAYKKIIKKNKIQNSYVGAIREEDKKVYAKLEYYGRNSEEFLLYDFAVKEGDVIKSSAIEGALSYPDGIKVVKIDTIKLETGEERKRFFFNETREWIEGIGSSGGFFSDTYFHVTSSTSNYLVCFKNGDTPLFVNTEKCVDGKCCEELTSHIAGNYYNTFTITSLLTDGLLSISIPSEYENEEIKIQVFNSMGKRVQTELRFNTCKATIDLTNQYSGVYCVVVACRNKTESYKIIKN